MEQIITLQVKTKNQIPLIEYDWREILKLGEEEYVTILDHWVIRGTIPPEDALMLNQQKGCCKNKNTCKKQFDKECDNKD